MKCNVEEKTKIPDDILNEDHRIFATQKPNQIMKFEEGNITIIATDDNEIVCGACCDIKVNNDNTINCGHDCEINAINNNHIDCYDHCNIKANVKNIIKCGNYCTINVNDKNIIICGNDCVIIVWDISTQDIIWDYNCVIFDKMDGKVYHNTTGAERFKLQVDTKR